MGICFQRSSAESHELAEERAAVFRLYHGSSIRLSLKSLAFFTACETAYFGVYCYLQSNAMFAGNTMHHEVWLAAASIAIAVSVLLLGVLQLRRHGSASLVKVMLCLPVVLNTLSLMARFPYMGSIFYGMEPECSDQVYMAGDCDYAGTFRLMLVNWAFHMPAVMPAGHALLLAVPVWSITWIPLCAACNRSPFDLILSDITPLFMLMTLILLAMLNQFRANVQWQLAMQTVSRRRQLERERDKARRCEAETAAAKKPPDAVPPLKQGAAVGARHVFCNVEDSQQEDFTVTVEHQTQPQLVNTLEVGQRVLCFDHVTGALQYEEIVDVKVEGQEEMLGKETFGGPFDHSGQPALPRSVRLYARHHERISLLVCTPDADRLM